MVDQVFVDKIEELRHNTYSRITDVQKDICPMVRDIYLNFQFEYWYEGYKHTLWEDDTHIYAVNDLPYCYDNELKNTTFKDTLDNLVAAGKIWPFLFFIDGVAIQWSKITVIHDYDYTYLRIDDFTSDTSFYARIVVFPLSCGQIRYGEDRDVLVTPNRKGFYFGKDGKRLESTDFVDISLRFEILSNDIYYKEINLNNITDHILEFTDLQNGFIPTLDNILTFTTDGSFNSLGPSIKIKDIYNGSYGMFRVLDNSSDVKWAILMYNTARVSTSKSYLYDKTDLSAKIVKNALKEKYDQETYKDFWNKFITPMISKFSFDHTFGVDYKTNIDNATKYITRYDFRLWRDTFISDVKMKSYTYTGKDFKNISDSKGFVHFSRKHSDLIEDVVIMFVNNMIYDYMVDVTYTTNTIDFPIFGIHDNDVVEILLFTECNNHILDIKVQGSTIPLYIHPEYNLEDCYIMSDECPDAEYEVPESLSGRKQYIVEFTYTINQDGNYLITFANDYYYNKSLKIVPKKQYRYYRSICTEQEYKITLPSQFNYCHDPDRYLIFVNGKKIDKTEYTITFMNKNRPFDKLVLYISTILDIGDYVDIFYIPELLVEKYKSDSFLDNGLLILKDEVNAKSVINYPNTYPLSKYTTLMFVNGYKVNPLEIKDVSLNSVLFHVDKYLRNEDGSIKKDGQGNPIEDNASIPSKYNITIMEYVIGNKEVAGYLKGLYEQIPAGQPYDPSKIDFTKFSADEWKVLINRIIDELGTDTIAYFFGWPYYRNEYEASYKENYADLRSVLYDAIIDYYMYRNDVNIGEGFVYDFEMDKFDKESSTSDIRDINLVPDKDKLLDYQISNNIATESDVLEGQKFSSIGE